MAVEIDKGIPIPPFSQRGATARFPWKNMDVGDSFSSNYKNAQTAYQTASRAGRIYHPKKFRAALHEGKWRIWRIE